MNAVVIAAKIHAVRRRFIPNVNARDVPRLIRSESSEIAWGSPSVDQEIAAFRARSWQTPSEKAHVSITTSLHVHPHRLRFHVPDIAPDLRDRALKSTNDLIAICSFRVTPLRIFMRRGATNTRGPRRVSFSSAAPRPAGMEFVVVTTT
jgi:hypothetical protein